MKHNKQDMNGVVNQGNLVNQSPAEIAKRGSAHGTEVVNVVD